MRGRRIKEDVDKMELVDAAGDVLPKKNCKATAAAMVSMFGNVQSANLEALVRATPSKTNGSGSLLQHIIMTTCSRIAIVLILDYSKAAKRV